MTEPLRNYGDNGGATTVYVVQAPQWHRAFGVTGALHRRPGATAVLARHKPQWHRHDRSGSAVAPSLIAVAQRKTVKTADLCGGTAETFNMFRRASAVLPPSHRRRGATACLYDTSRSGTAMIAVAPQRFRH